MAVPRRRRAGLGGSAVGAVGSGRPTEAASLGQASRRRGPSQAQHEQQVAQYGHGHATATHRDHDTPSKQAASGRASGAVPDWHPAAPFGSRKGRAPRPWFWSSHGGHRAAAGSQSETGLRGALDSVHGPRGSHVSIHVRTAWPGRGPGSCWPHRGRSSTDGRFQTGIEAVPFAPASASPPRRGPAPNACYEWGVSRQVPVRPSATARRDRRSRRSQCGQTQRAQSTQSTQIDAIDAVGGRKGPFASPGLARSEGGAAKAIQCRTPDGRATPWRPGHRFHWSTGLPSRWLEPAMMGGGGWWRVVVVTGGGGDGW